MVLVIDDDSAVRNSLMFTLDVEGFAVRAFSNALDLLDSPELPACCCLIVDQRLPGMTGLELLSVLRNRKINTPAILITSHPDAALRRKAAEAHVPIIEKPFMENTLIERVRETIAPGSSSTTS